MLRFLDFYPVLSALFRSLAGFFFWCCQSGPKVRAEWLNRWDYICDVLAFARAGAHRFYVYDLVPERVNTEFASLADFVFWDCHRD